LGKQILKFDITILLYIKVNMDDVRVLENTDSIVFNKLIKSYDPSKYLSNNFMTKYEKTTIIGVRMEQLAFGAQSTLDKDTLSNMKDIKQIAKEELNQKKIPFLLCRTLPDKTEEYWRVSDLIVFD
jgi:DNA-directed RNA polymerase subunit K/omega